MISKLIADQNTRESYIRSKLSVLIPAQIRSLRLRRGMTQSDLGSKADMKQARVSAVERIGVSNLSVETLTRLASALRVGLSIRFVSFGEMLDWENKFQPDSFEVSPIEIDRKFIEPNIQDLPAMPAEMINAMSGSAVYSSHQMSAKRLASGPSELHLASTLDQVAPKFDNAIWAVIGASNESSNGAVA